MNELANQFGSKSKYFHNGANKNMKKSIIFHKPDLLWNKNIIFAANNF
jgi:hypothetical protein